METKETAVSLVKKTLSADSVKLQFKNALRDNSDAFIASIVEMVSQDKKLQTCDHNKVVGEALKAATMNLPINKALGFSYIVCYDVWDKEKKAKVPTPTFIVGYKGLIQLAMRTGEYRIINADVVYEGELKNTSKLTGEIDLSGEKTSDKVVGYFAHIEMRNGFVKTLYMTVEQMAKYAKMNSKAIPASTSVAQLVELANKQVDPDKDKVGNVGWLGNFTAMARKTVLRRLLGTYGYLSIHMQNALSTPDDDGGEATTRNGAIVSGANKTDVDIEDTQYVEITPEAVDAPATEEEATEDNPY